MKKLDYPYIRAWGRMMGSHSYYVDDQVEKARRNKAPQNAVYYNINSWQTFDKVTNPHTIAVITRLVREAGQD